MAPIILGEIGDIDRVVNAKQLVAFSGIDPTVKQSGNFVGTKNKVTKRGSPFLRHIVKGLFATYFSSNKNCG